MPATEIVLQGNLGISLIQALLAVVSLVAIAAFGYIMGRLSTIDEKVGMLNEMTVDLHQRLYGREHDRTDPGGFLAEVRTEFGRLHSRMDTFANRLDHDRRERKNDHHEIERKLDRINDEVTYVQRTRRIRHAEAAPRRGRHPRYSRPRFAGQSGGEAARGDPGNGDYSDPGNEDDPADDYDADGDETQQNGADDDDW